MTVESLRPQCNKVAGEYRGGLQWRCGDRIGWGGGAPLPRGV